MQTVASFAPPARPFLNVHIGADVLGLPHDVAVDIAKRRVGRVQRTTVGEVCKRVVVCFEQAELRTLGLVAAPDTNVPVVPPG